MLGPDRTHVAFNLSVSNFSVHHGNASDASLPRTRSEEFTAVCSAWTRGLADRVRGSSLHIRNHCQILSGDGIDDAGLARIPATKEADVNPISGWGIVHAHGNLSFHGFICMAL